MKVRLDGTVKVLDFGLAKALEPTGSPGMSQAPTITTPAMTQAGMILGTAAYMSPEQARGKPLDKRADIWAFGCVLFEMLTGRRVFTGEDVTDTIVSVVSKEPDWAALPSHAPAMSFVLRRCLEKDPKKRLRDVGEARLALEGAFETGVSQTVEAVVMPPLAAWRQPLPVGVAALLVGAVVTGLVAWSFGAGPEPEEVNRFGYSLPASQVLWRIGRPALTVSPDGRSFIYNTTEGLYLRSMSELEARLIPGTEKDLAGPFFSPDGQSVGYYALEGSQLERISISGGTPIVIADATGIPFGASWGADGTILFAQPEGILRVSANGGTPELVIAAEEGEQVHGPQLLPDGDSVLFSVTTATGDTRWDEAQIVVQSLSTGARTVVVQGGSDARYLPTGHLIYALGTNLLGTTFDTENLSVSGGVVPLTQGVLRAVVPSSNTASANYGVSDQGTLVYLAGGVGDGSTLVRVDRQGQETLLAAPSRVYTGLRVSPDGARVAVMVAGDIWVWDDGRGTLTRLTFDDVTEASPLWAPDGTRIAYASSRDGGGIYWTASDGTGEVERLLDSEVLPNAWGPDGRIFFHTLDGDIGMLSTVGERVAETLIGTEFREGHPALSPDGRWLAYSSNESGQTEVYVRPFPDIARGLWQVSTTGGIEPVWAPDGRTLFYNDFGRRLMSVAVEADVTFVARTPEMLFPLNNVLLPATDSSNYDIAPDGEHFLFLQRTVTTDTDSGTAGDIIVVQNWFEELRRLVPTD